MKTVARQQPAKELHERIYNYVEKVFQDSGRTVFPTVKQVSIVLEVSVFKVRDEVNGCPKQNMFLAYYNAEKTPAIRDHYVETINDD